jgi:hypothetical protein
LAIRGSIAHVSGYCAPALKVITVATLIAALSIGDLGSTATDTITYTYAHIVFIPAVFEVGVLAVQTELVTAAGRLPLSVLFKPNAHVLVALGDSHVAVGDSSLNARAKTTQIEFGARSDPGTGLFGAKARAFDVTIHGKAFLAQPKLNPSTRVRLIALST